MLQTAKAAVIPAPTIHITSSPHRSGNVPMQLCTQKAAATPVPTIHTTSSPHQSGNASKQIQPPQVLNQHPDRITSSQLRCGKGPTLKLTRLSQQVSNRHRDHTSSRPLPFGFNPRTAATTRMSLLLLLLSKPPPHPTVVTLPLPRPAPPVLHTGASHTPLRTYSSKSRVPGLPKPSKNSCTRRGERSTISFTIWVTMPFLLPEGSTGRPRG